MELKSRKDKRAIAAVLAIGAILIWMILSAGNSSPYGDFTVNSTDDAAAFLLTLGWETELTGAEIQESMLPTEFDDTFYQYNELQLAQGCDLTKYGGKSITVYTLPVTNYPNTADRVLATVIVYKSTIIGGDIHAAKLDGFMHGLQ